VPQTDAGDCERKRVCPGEGAALGGLGKRLRDETGEAGEMAGRKSKAAAFKPKERHPHTEMAEGIAG